MDKKTLRKADMVFSLLLMAVAAYVFFNSFSLYINPFGRKFEKLTGNQIKENIVNWNTSPALMPFLISLVLFLCAVLLFRNARREGAKFDFFKRDKIVAFIKQRETYVFLVVSAILCLYVFAFIPLCRRYLNLFPAFQAFPFMVSTFLFLALMMIVFNRKTAGKILTSLLVAASASALITLGFGTLAMIPLP